MALRRVCQLALACGVAAMTGCMARSSDPFLDFAVGLAQGSEVRVYLVRVDDPSLAPPTAPAAGGDVVDMRVLSEEDARTAVPLALLTLTGPTTRLRAQGLERLRLAAASVGADALMNVRLGPISMSATAARLPASGTNGGAR